MKKSSSKHLLVLSLLLSVFTSNAQIYSGGTGTGMDPYIITTKTDLRYLSEHENQWDKFFRQTTNIYFISSDFQTGGDFYNSGQGFKPIGNDLTPFTGTYDGSGYLIDSLYINRPNEDYQGFFGKKVWGVISGLGLTNVSIKGQSYNGGLAGYIDGDVGHCYVTGNVSGNLNYTAGLVGYHSNGVINDCHSEAHVEGNVIGGLAGWVDNSTISNCSSTGNIDGNNSSYVGGLIGIIGWTPSTTVTNCHASGNVNGNYAVGGLIGHANGIITNCFASGQVNGNYSGGGLVGFTAEGNSIINCYATGDVNGTQFLGGLIGYNSGDVRNCHAVGSVISSTGNDTIGGLSGGNQGNFLHCFWDMQTSGLTNSFGGTGLTTSDMKNIQTFISSSWDFELETSNGINDIWKMGGCSFDYPVFSWQTIIPHPSSSSTEYACGSFTWDINGLTYISTGTYLDMIQNSSGCDSLIILNLTINILPSDFVYDNGDGTLIASFGTSYQWFNCFTNAPIAGATNQLFAPSKNGSYFVLVSYESGCSVTSSCISMVNLDLSDWSTSSVQVYPNPTEDMVTISMSVNNAIVAITDVQGKTHFVGSVTNGQQISLASYEDGVYFLSIEIETGKILKRIVKN